MTNQVPSQIQTSQTILLAQRLLDSVLSNIQHTGRVSRSDRSPRVALGYGNDAHILPQSFPRLNRRDLLPHTQQVLGQRRKIHNLLF
jgi:hypothetical protein